jgi:hypothetical protein
MRTRRLILVPSNKGGIGKTTVAKVIGEQHRRKNTGCIIVDADAGVGGLLRHLGDRDAEGEILPAQSIESGVLAIDWHQDVRSRDAIADVLAHGRDVLIDLPGGSLGTLKALADETDLFEVVRSAGFEPTIVCCVTPYRETWGDVRDVQAWLPNADIVAVVNEGFGDHEDFTEWRSSKTRVALLAGRGREIIFPRLEPRIAARIAWHRLRFCDAPTSELLAVLDRGRVHHWLRRATAAIREVGDCLGLQPMKEVPK